MLGAIIGQTPQRGPSWGESLGHGIGGALQQLAQTKLQTIQSQNQQRNLMQTLESLNLNPSAAGLPENVLNTYLKQKLQEPGNAAYSQALNQILGNNQEQQMVPGQQMQPGQPGVPGQQQQQQQIPPLAGLNQQQAGQLAQLALKKESTDLKKKESQEAEAREIRKEIKPFIHGHKQDFKTAKELHKIASEMKEIATKYGSEFPGWPFGLLPSNARRNPNVRRYEQLANQLVTVKSNGLKGQPTNFKVKLLQAGKVDLDQPLETQLAELDSVINNSSETFKVEDILKDIRTGNKGNLPLDVEELVEERLSANNPNIQSEQKQQEAASKQSQKDLPPPGVKYKEGSEWEVSPGEIIKYTNGSWI